MKLSLLLIVCLFLMGCPLEEKKKDNLVSTPKSQNNTEPEPEVPIIIPHVTSEYVTVPQNNLNFYKLACNGVNVIKFSTSGTMYVGTKCGLSISEDNGQTFNTKTTANGLGSNDVKDIFIHNSNIYAGTSGGLSISSDNGETFSNIGSDVTGLNSVSTVFVKTIDSVDKIYIGTSSAGNYLAISEDNGETFYRRTASNGANANIYQIYIHTDNVIYLATNGGLCISTDHTGVSFSKKTSASNSLGSNFVYGVAVDSSGIVYAATNSGLSISTDSSADSFVNKVSANNNMGNNQILGVSIDSSKIYVWSNSGFAISSDLTGDSFSNKTTSDGLASNYVSNMTTRSDGNFYVSTSAGVSVSTDSTASSYTSIVNDLVIPEGSYRDSSFLAVNLENGDMYSSTKYGTGFLKSSDNGETFSSINRTDNNISNDTVYTVIVKNNVIYSGHYYGGLNISTDHGETFTAYKNGLDSTARVFGIYVKDSNNICVGTSGGLGVTTDGGQNFSLFTNATNSLANNKVNNCYIDSDGVIYAGTDSGLSISMDNGATFTTFLSSQVFSLYVHEDAGNKTIFVGRPLGFDKSNTFTSINVIGDISFGTTITQYNSNLENHRINDIFYHNNKLYLATDIGVGISEDFGENFTLLKTETGLSSTKVFKITADKDGNLIFMTDGGLTIANPY